MNLIGFNKIETLIETKRLLIREITLEDCEDLFKLHSDPEVQKFTGEPVVESIDQIKNGIRENTLKDYENYGYGRWAIIIKDTNLFIGWAGLKYLPEFNKVDLVIDSNKNTRVRDTQRKLP